MIINEAGLRLFIKDKGNGRQVSREYREKLEATVRHMVKQSMDWPRNRKVLKDFF